MTEPVTNSIDITASVPRVIEVISDLENTDRWANEARSADVVGRDDHGRPAQVKVTLGAIGFTTTATYDVAYTDSSVTLTCVDGSLIRESVIAYTATDAGNGTTHVEMSSTMEVTVPVPQWGLTRAMKRSGAKNLESVRSDAESGSRAA